LRKADSCLALLRVGTSLKIDLYRTVATIRKATNVLFGQVRKMYSALVLSFVNKSLFLKPFVQPREWSRQLLIK